MSNNSPTVVEISPTQFNSYNCLLIAFTSVVLISNVIGAKVIQIAPFILPVGIFIFPVSYVLNSSITELYGYRLAKRAILLGLLANIFLAVCIHIAIILPPAANWAGQEAYVQTLGASNQIILGSLLSFCVGELLNSFSNWLTFEHGNSHPSVRIKAILKVPGELSTLDYKVRLKALMLIQ